ncbi:MAG: DUF2974 domain-containing protein [Lachnospiraceae bacterium]|nr:DUF2974 domain-containing protein [Lachnospiraceae bacterium]
MTMANIIDYLDWRGDVSLREDPFNAVDNLVLSWMAYVNLDEIMPKEFGSESMTIKEVVNLFFTKYDLEEKLSEKSLTRTSALLFYKMGDCPRFANMRISNYVNYISEELEQQFSAMTIEIDEKTMYIAYRGTDDTIVGWKEDFNMSFLPFVPSQEAAVRYLEATMKSRNWRKRIIVGGHSKGGNLAVYASIKCNKAIRRKIIQVYNNDGPGFLEETMQLAEYQEMLPRIRTIVPESSVVGMLLGHEEQYDVVVSSQKGILQHDAATWEVQRNDFIYLESVSDSSMRLDKALKKWLSAQNEAQRRLFVEQIFALLEATGAKTTLELAAMGLKNANQVIRAMANMDPEVRQKLREFVRALIEITSDERKALRSKDME